MRRRRFIALLGTAAAWPLVIAAQQAPGPRRIGLLMSTAENDAESQVRVQAFLQGLKERG